MKNTTHKRGTKCLQNHFFFFPNHFFDALLTSATFTTGRPFGYKTFTPSSRSRSRAVRQSFTSINEQMFLLPRTSTGWSIRTSIRKFIFTCIFSSLAPLQDRRVHDQPGRTVGLPSHAPETALDADRVALLVRCRNVLGSIAAFLALHERRGSFKPVRPAHLHAEIHRRHSVGGVPQLR